jgi:hypothetical protein
LSGKDAGVGAEVVARMRIDRVGDDDYWTAESVDDLRGWEIIHIEAWKDGVSRLHCYRPLDTATVEFHQIYCRNIILRLAMLELSLQMFNQTVLNSARNEPRVP